MAKPQSMAYTRGQKAAMTRKKNQAIKAGILDETGTRKKLKKIGIVERQTFYGEFVRCGRKPNGTLTMLFINIRNDKGNVVSDHVWFNLTQGFKGLGFIEVGELIQFDARVQSYEKGYKGFNPDILKQKGSYIVIDYKLSHPSKIKRFLGKAGQRISTIDKWDKAKKLRILEHKLKRLEQKYERFYRWQEYQNI